MKSIVKPTLLAAVISASLNVNALEISSKTTFENASFASDGTSIGDTNAHGSGDNFKNELSSRIYFDGEINPSSTYHVEVQAFQDFGANAIKRGSPDVPTLGNVVYSYKEGEAYTQRDPLREAYIDTHLNDISLRLGKQQVVWGTADGMKLLDMINPTDFSEVAQNQMEDSRIPVWMMNAEKILIKVETFNL